MRRHFHWVVLQERVTVEAVVVVGGRSVAAHHRYTRERGQAEERRMRRVKKVCVEGWSMCFALWNRWKGYRFWSVCSGGHLHLYYHIERTEGILWWRWRWDATYIHAPSQHFWHIYGQSTWRWGFCLYLINRADIFYRRSCVSEEFNNRDCYYLNVCIYAPNVEERYSRVERSWNSISACSPLPRREEPPRHRHYNHYLINLQQLHLKIQIGIGWNNPTGPSSTISKIGSNS